MPLGLLTPANKAVTEGFPTNGYACCARCRAWRRGSCWSGFAGSAQSKNSPHPPAPLNLNLPPPLSRSRNRSSLVDHADLDGEEEDVWAARSASTNPSLVCGLASMVGLRFNVARAFEVSGPMEASLVPGNLLSNPGRSKRVWKCSTVELLVKVSQSAPVSNSLAAMSVGSSVSGTV